MFRRDFLSLALGMLPLIGCSRNAKEPAWEAAVVDLEKQIRERMDAGAVPGVSVAVINDAKIVWRGGFGVKNSATKEPVDVDTVFEAASTSKPVFAYAVLKLCEKGTIDLDTPLTRYTTQRFLEDDPRLNLITARHVLSHTSGFQNWRSDDAPLKIHFTPGEKFLYSGEGYSYLQSIVTHLADQPIEPYMKTNVFMPFGMESSGYIWNDMFEKRVATGHDKDGRPIHKVKDARTTEEGAERYAAAGALLSTPTDYGKFIIEVIAPKPADAFRLNTGSLKEMLRPHVKIPDDPFSASWALGWQIHPTENGPVISHGGTNKGFRAFAMATLERKSGFVIMTNGDNGNQIIDHLLLGNVIGRLL